LTELPTGRNLAAMANGSPVPPPGPRGGSLSILASVQLPGVQLWIVGDDHSCQALASMLQGEHLILTLAHVQQIFKNSQRRVIVPQLALKKS